MVLRSPGFGRGEFYRGDQLVVAQGRAVEAGEELGGRDAPLVGGIAGDDDGVERNAAGGQLGGRIGEGQRAADGAAVADGGMRDQRHRLGEQRDVLADQRVAAEFRVRGESADADRVAGLRDAAQLSDARDVDQRAGIGQAEGERGEQALPAGEQLGVGAGVAPEMEGVGERRRPDISKWRRLHDVVLLPALRVLCDRAWMECRVRPRAEQDNAVIPASAPACLRVHAQCMVDRVSCLPLEGGGWNATDLTAELHVSAGSTGSLSPMAFQVGVATVTSQLNHPHPMRPAAWPGNGACSTRDDGRSKPRTHRPPPRGGGKRCRERDAYFPRSRPPRKPGFFAASAASISGGGAP